MASSSTQVEVNVLTLGVAIMTQLNASSKVPNAPNECSMCVCMCVGDTVIRTQDFVLARHHLSQTSRLNVQYFCRFWYSYHCWAMIVVRMAESNRKDTLNSSSLLVLYMVYFVDISKIFQLPWIVFIFHFFLQYDSHWDFFSLQRI